MAGSASARPATAGPQPGDAPRPRRPKAAKDAAWPGTILIGRRHGARPGRIDANVNPGGTAGSLRRTMLRGRWRRAQRRFEGV